MERSSIIHYADNRFCFPLARDRFLIRLRAKRGDLRRAVLHTQDKYLPLQIKDTRAVREMQLAARDAVSDYFETEISMHLVCLRYWFELEGTDGTCVFYSNYQFTDQPVTDIERMFDCPQTLREEEMLEAPDWAAGKVVYQIFPASFAPTGPVPKGWSRARIDHRVDPGGTLQGILQHLDHIHQLGADVLYLTPVFHAGTPHRYDTIDYYAVDPKVGTEEDLRELVRQAHSLGMRVILDGVFNHTSQKFFAFADIAEKGPDSPYWNWYYIEGYPLQMAWGKKPNFKTFSYFGGMPKLNLRNPETAAYIIGVAKHWIQTCDIDGWRLDVSDEVGHRFWRHFREAIREVKPDALLIGEEWHYGGDFLTGDQWDTVMNYDFYRSVLDLIGSERISITDFFHSLGFLRGNLHPKVYAMLWNLNGSHDTPRLLREMGGDRAKVRLAAALQLLLPGMPMVYYGDEVAMDGGDHGDCRRGMQWDEAKQDREMLAWYRKLIALRHRHPCLTCGKTVLFRTDDATRTAVWTRCLQGDSTTLLFHAGPGEASFPDLAGQTDLLTDAPFSGTLGPWGTAVLA